jgi:hypothetical protein
MANFSQDDDYYVKEILPFLKIPIEEQEVIKEKLKQAKKITTKETEERISKEFRETFSNHVLRLFKISNTCVAILILIAFICDQYFIYKEIYKTPDFRLITPQVLMILIGATATQIAVAFALLSKYVFKIFEKNKNLLTTATKEKP